MAKPDLLDPERFLFRGLHPGVFIGTASDRYKGWLGQIYSEGRYENRISKRSSRVGGKRFQVETLPIDCVQEYFQHFRVLEIDFTFYAPLIDEHGLATHNHELLMQYSRYMEEDDFLILKAPQAFFAQKLRRGSGYIENPGFLNPEQFTSQFYEPAKQILGSRLRGMVFEQEYQRIQERMPPRELAGALNRFFSAVPGDGGYHVELRTESYLCQPVFDVLEKHGIGQVLAHWTWLPPLPAQLKKAGNQFFNSKKHSLIRIMTPIGIKYEDAYAMAHPFDRLIDGMPQDSMTNHTVRIIREGLDQGIQMHVLINNRAGGNAPLLAQQIANLFLSGGS